MLAHLVDDQSYDVYDPYTPPPPEICDRCGGPIPWEWYQCSRNTGQVRGPYAHRWLRYKEVCDGCKVIVEQREQAETVGKRQRHAGIPERYTRYRFHRYVQQTEKELIQNFVARVSEKDPPCIGITKENQAIMRELRGWKPSKGSVYVQGIAGSGKTMAVIALCNQLLEEPMCFEYVERPGKTRAVRVKGGHTVRYLSEEDLYSLVRSFSRRSRRQGNDEEDPLDVALNVGVLILDDLGSVEAASDKEWQTDLIFRLVETRYRKGLPLLVTSNYPMSHLRTRFGERTMSRLGEMCGHRVYRMPQVPWRTHVATMKPRADIEEDMDL